MAQHVFKVGDQIRMANLTFRVRKITQKDLILREVKPPVTAQAQAQARKKKGAIGKDAIENNKSL